MTWPDRRDCYAKKVLRCLPSGPVRRGVRWVGQTLARRPMARGDRERYTAAGATHASHAPGTVRRPQLKCAANAARRQLI